MHGKPLEGIWVKLAESGGRESESVSDQEGWYWFEAEPGDYTLFVPRGLPVSSTSRWAIDLGRLSRHSVVLKDAVIGDSSSNEAREPHLDLLHGSLLTGLNLDILPTARDIWSVLENQETSTVVNRVDSAGITVESTALFSGRGSSWVQNAFRFNGLDISDPERPGVPLLIPPYDAVRAVQVVTAGHSAAEAGPGEAVEILTRNGGDSTHGEARLYYQGAPTQWDADSSRLRAQGSLGAPRVRQHWEGVAQLGGPLFREVRYFGSFLIRDSSVRLPGFTPPVARRLVSGLAKVDTGLGRHGGIGFLVTGQGWDQDHAGASFRTAPLSTLDEDDGFRTVQGNWTWEPARRLNLDARLGYAKATLNHLFQQPVTRQAEATLFTGFRSGAAPSELESDRSRLGFQSGISWLPASRAFFQQFQTGVEFSRGQVESDVRVFEDVGLAFLPSDLGADPLSRVPSSSSLVWQYNTPSQSRYSVDSASVYLQHRMVPFEGLSVGLGLRIDSMSGSLGEQASPSGLYAGTRRLAPAPDLISWTNAAPRLSLSAMPFGPGTVVRFAAGRYHHLLSGLLLQSVNPMHLSGSIRRWADTSGDRQFQVGEQGALLKLFGPEFTAIDHGLKRPRTDEILLGAEQALPGGFVLRGDLVRREEKNRIETVNIGVPLSSYNPVQIHDAGGDWVVGTGDDQDLTIYDQKSATLGQDSYLLTNPPGLSAKHEGVELTLSRDMARFSFSLAFGAYRTFARTGPGNSELQNDQGVIGSLFDDPNADINSYGRVYFDRSFTAKLLAFYRAPRDVTISAVARYYDGLPFARMLVVTGMNQGPFAIMATPRGNPGGHRTEYHRTVDLRVRKSLGLFDRRLGLVLDIFNLLNDDQKTLEGDFSGPRFSQRIPLATQAPRVARIGLELEF